MTDQQTIAAYDANVEAYANTFKKSGPGRALARFMSFLPNGGNVLDLGCGPGRHAALMHEHGFNVDAVDASSAMVARARQHKGIDVRQANFSDLDTLAHYDGIWANFSLLHGSRADFPRHLDSIACALKPAGMFHLGMKTGAGEKRDTLGRIYTFYSVDELFAALNEAGFDIIHSQEGEGPGLAGTIDPWVEILARLR